MTPDSRATLRSLAVLGGAAFGTFLLMGTVASAAVDLTPRTAAVGPIPIAPGEPLTVTTVVRNAGDTAAANVVVRACDGGGWCALRTVPSIGPGSEVTVRLTLASAPVHIGGNPHFFGITVDPQNKIPETNETNNNRPSPQPAFVVTLDPIPPVVEEEHDEVIQIVNGVAVSYDRVGFGVDGAPSTIEVVADPDKGRPHPVTGHVETGSSGVPRQPRIDPLVVAADESAGPGQRLTYVVKFRHGVPMPRLPHLTDTSDRFAPANIPILEARLSAFESVRRARIAAAAELVQQLTQRGGNVTEYFTLAGAMRVDAPRGLLAFLDGRPEVLHVEAVRRGETPPNTVADGRALIDSDPYFNGGATGAGYIALLDTGVWTSHTLLDVPDRILFREDCVNGNGDCDDTGAAAYDPNDDCWDHGTSTAAILTGNGDLGNDSRGITTSWVDSWKVYDCAGLDTTAVHRGYDEAVRWGDQIVVAEIQSTTGPTGSIADDADNAFDAGTITIAANGNYSTAGSVASPACAHKAIGVGNYDVDTLAAIASQSRGPTSDSRYKPDIQAPTNTITASTSGVSTVNSFGGTSGATPYAAGAASVFADWFGLTSLTQASGGKIYAALINGGPQDWGNFDNTEGTGKFALPLNGTLFLGSRSVSNNDNEYVDFNVPAGATKISVALWWGENPSNTHRDIDLYLRRPDGTTSASSISGVSVFEHIIVSSPAAGLRDIRIYGYDVPAFVNVTVYYAIHVQ
jgi:serine protease AprX